MRIERDGRLLVAMADPANVFAIDDLRILTGKDIRPALAMPEEITAILGTTARIDEMVADLVDEADDEDEVPTVSDIREATEDDPPVVKLVNR